MKIKTRLMTGVSVLALMVAGCGDPSDKLSNDEVQASELQVDNNVDVNKAWDMELPDQDNNIQ